MIYLWDGGELNQPFAGGLKVTEDALDMVADIGDTEDLADRAISLASAGLDNSRRSCR